MQTCDVTVQLDQFGEVQVRLFLFGQGSHDSCWNRRMLEGTLETPSFVSSNGMKVCFCLARAAATPVATFGRLMGDIATRCYCYLFLQQ